MEEVLRIKQEPWWSLLIRGICIIILGIMAFSWPGLTLAVLMIFFGAFVLVDGIFAIVVSVSKHKVFKQLRSLLLEALVGIVVGIIVFMEPLIAGLVMFYLIAAWLLIGGIIRIVTAIMIRKETPMGAPLALGIVLVLLGLAIFFIPIITLLTMLWLIAAFAIVIGIFLLVGAVQVRKLGRASS